MCYCRNDTPCQSCLDVAHTEQNSPDLLAAQRSFADASADFYIPGWTPEDEDSREHDRKILDDMTAEAHDNPDMAHALLTLYPDDTFTQSDLDAMRKHYDTVHASLTMWAFWPEAPPDDAFTAADLAAMMKHDAKDWGSNEGEV